MMLPRSFPAAALAVTLSGCAASGSPVGASNDGGTITSDAPPVGVANNGGVLSQGDGASAEQDAATKPVATGMRVFATSATHNGNLGGLAGADALCEAAAKAAKLGGTFKAWLSDSTTNASQRIAAVGPWTLVDGTAAFKGKSVTSFPVHDLDMDENGETGKKGLVWTGTVLGGNASTETCNDWSSTGASGTSGYPHVIDDWNDDGSGGSPCNLGGRLYCFEQ